VAVGDDAQNIYSFRGSNIEHILNFDKKFDNISKHKLVINYRSTPEIVNMANESIEKNKFQIPKKMIAYNESIDSIPTVKFYRSWNKRTKFIIKYINYYISIGIKRDDIAILSRTNFPLMSIEEELTKLGINNVYLDGKSDVRSKIKDDHVCLSTIHKAKGLEWCVVFIINANDEMFPSGKNDLDIEEERRLFYVAITRAKKYLHVVFTPVYGTIYVSRFISELSETVYNFKKFNTKYIGYSESGYHDYNMSVTELVKNLDGVDYVKLKDSKILIDFQTKNIKLYEKYNYLDFIKNNDLYSDFGIFIDCLISRMIGEEDKKSEGLYYESAILAITNLKLNVEEYSVYRKYKIFFTNNLDKLNVVDFTLSDRQIIINKLISSCACDSSYSNDYFSTNDKYMLFNIIDKLFVISSKFNLPIHKIPIFSERFLPEDFEEHMEIKLKNFTNENIQWDESIFTIWEIAKCDKIVKDGRRRLLYKDICADDLKQYKNLYLDIHKHYVGQLKNKKSKCHYGVKLDNGIHGEIDLLVDSTVVDFKTSYDCDIKAEWIIQTLCYAHMCRLDGKKIDKIQIFNPLQGTVHIINISGWNKGSALIDYLLEKRQMLIDRTNMIKNYPKKSMVSNHEINNHISCSDKSYVNNKSGESCDNEFLFVNKREHIKFPTHGSMSTEPHNELLSSNNKNLINVFAQLKNRIKQLEKENYELKNKYLVNKKSLN
jgi:hypothetical protein